MSNAALMDRLAKMGFRETIFNHTHLYLAPDIAGEPHTIAGRLKAIDPQREAAAGNRRSAILIAIPGLPPMVARRGRRGGLMRFVAAGLYAGLAPRPLRELAVAACAHRRGLPVAQPLGAMVEWVGPCLYRGWFLTRALEGMTLWQLMLSGCEPQVRREALEQSRAGIDRIHDGGLFHADLNFHNVFVCIGAQPLHVVFLDLDKARLFPEALPKALRRSNFDRLKRSARKLIAAGARLTPEEQALLGIDRW